METENYQERMKRRMRWLAISWSALRTANLPQKDLFTFNHSIASKVIRHYSNDLDILKKRYNIPTFVQTPKIAGLMANAILKYRPLVPSDSKQANIEGNEVNEYLALYHGLIVCANFKDGGKQNIENLKVLTYRYTE